MGAALYSDFVLLIRNASLPLTNSIKYTGVELKDKGKLRDRPMRLLLEIDEG